MNARPTRLLSFAGLLAAAACSSGGQASDRGATVARSEAQPAAAAELDGSVISVAELDTRVGAGNLLALREKEYELRKQALDGLLEEKLLAREASARKLSVDELTAREVDAKTPAPAREEVERLYEQNRARFQNAPREDVMLQIQSTLVSRARETRRAAYRRELVRKAGVRLLLEPPRASLEVPAEAPALGPAGAPVTIVAFADYQCPYCRHAESTVEQVMKLYEGKLRLVHRDYPLDGHPRAFPASRAAHCAGEQGKFWEYHRDLLLGSGDMSDQDLRARAEKLGLNLTSFSSCLASGAADAKIRAALAEGGRVGVTGTPTFFINGRRIDGARPLDSFQELIDEELARAR